MSSEVHDVFPELERIDDDDLREKVVTGFEIALSEGGFDSLSDVPWAPHYADEVGDQKLTAHVRDVTAVAMAITDSLNDRRDAAIERDSVVAGSLVHDISKLFEYEDDGAIREYLGHPHFCVYPLQKAGLPVSIQHIAISHTPRSSVEPKTMEAVIVHRADQLAMEGIFLEATDAIRRAAD